MSFLGLFSDGRDKRMNQQGMEKFGGRSEGAFRTFGDMMGQMKTQAGQAYDRGDQSVEERYGDVLNNATDQANAQAASTRAGLTRANMATGGDISGSTGVGMAQADQRGNRAIQDAFRTYTQMNDQANRQSRSRGDQLLSRGAGMNQRQYQMDTGNMQDYEMREIQRRQADRQTLAGLLGAGLGVAGQAIGRPQLPASE